MLYDHAETIQESLASLRDAVALMTIRLSEDKRNEPLCQRLRAIREEALDKAATISRAGSEPALERAIALVEDGLIKLHEIEREIFGRKGNEHLHIYPYKLTADEKGREFEYTHWDNGNYTGRNYTLTGTTRERFRLLEEISNLDYNTCMELKACGVELPAYDRVIAEDFNGEIHEPDAGVYLWKLRLSMMCMMTRLDPMGLAVDLSKFSEDDRAHMTNPAPFSIEEEALIKANAGVIHKLAKLEFQSGEAGGNGFIAQMEELVDPVEALSAPPPPSAKQVGKKYDAVFTELYALMNGTEIKGVIAPRDSQACRMGLQGGIREIKSYMEQAVKDLERRGFELPQYHEAADKGRRK